MVDDLLDLSRIQSGRVEMKRHPVFVRSLLEGACNLHQATAAEKGIHLTADLQTLLEEKVNADPERIALVLANLITTAIRPTDSGGTIMLRAICQDKRMRFEVSDYGRGDCA